MIELQDIRTAAICEHLHTSYFEIMDGDSGDLMDMTRIVAVKSKKMDGKGNHGVSETAFGVDKEEAMKEFGWGPKP